MKLFRRRRIFATNVIIGEHEMTVNGKKFPWYMDVPGPVVERHNLASDEHPFWQRIVYCPIIVFEEDGFIDVRSAQ